MSVEAGVLDDGFDRTGTLATVRGVTQQLRQTECISHFMITKRCVSKCEFLV